VSCWLRLLWLPPPLHSSSSPSRYPSIAQLCHLVGNGSDLECACAAGESCAAEGALPQCIACGDGLSLDELATSPTSHLGRRSQKSATTTRASSGSATSKWTRQRLLPFVRLALARYQPESIADAHLSRGRAGGFHSTLTGSLRIDHLRPIDTTSLELAITGKTYRGPGEVKLTATLETQPPGAGDQAWVPVQLTALSAELCSARRRSGPLRSHCRHPEGHGPSDCSSKSSKLSPRIASGAEQRRLVYADILSI